MNTCRPIPSPPSSPSSIVAAALASFGLTLLFFWGLAQSSDHLQPVRSAPTTQHAA